MYSVHVFSSKLHTFLSYKFASFRINGNNKKLSENEANKLQIKQLVPKLFLVNVS